MSTDGPSEITVLLGELRRGNDSAREKLVRPSIRSCDAAYYMRQERPEHTLRTIGLVKEMYVRLFRAGQADWRNRAHFFAAGAREAAHPGGLRPYAQRAEAAGRTPGAFAQRSGDTG